MAQDRKTPWGFAAMDPARQREIASMGGKAGHEKGTSHEFSSEEARIAGRKGGKRTAETRYLKKVDAAIKK